MKNAYLTDKFPCIKCGKRMMYPNIANGHVEGYKCANCGKVSHPVMDKLDIKPYTSKKNAESITGTSNCIPPLIIMCGTEFVICNSDYDINLLLNPKNMRHSSAFVISDTNGSLLESYGRTFKRNGYTVKVLNTASFSESARYNPFAYIRNDTDIPKLVTALISGTKGNGNPGDYSFILDESNLLMALISFIHSEAPEMERNFNMLTELLNNMEIHDEYVDFKNAVDILFEEKERHEPNHLSVTRYNHFRRTTDKNMKQIINSCTERLASLDTSEMQDFLSNDELSLDWLHFPKTALFVITEKTDDAFKFIAPLMYSQLLNGLYEKTV